MANLKEIRTRIASVTSTKQITSAMKMVSAAKLRKAQEAILQLRPYADKLSEILSAIGDTMKNDKENVFVNQREAEKILLVVITSNKGLCGAFNSSVIKKSLTIAYEKYGEQFSNNNVDFLMIGKKGDDYLRKKNYPILDRHNDIFDNLNYESVSKIAIELMDMFREEKYDRIELIYNQFKNAAVQILSDEQFLPVEIREEEAADVEESILTTYIDYIFEPTKEYIVKELIPKSLKIQLYKALLDSNASEHGARMTAMHKATDNATELLKDLRLDYNKARQANITNEILEIVSGANALEGS